MNYAGLIYNDSRHYIDHLAPFCALMNWPLIACEPAVAELARRYYPDLHVIEVSWWDLKLPSCVVTCESRPLLQAAFPHQTCRILWLPHGNSDKGGDAPFFADLGDIALVYGKQMANRVQTKHMLRIGNFRFAYFLKHQAFYQDIGQPGILYAPTWDDREGNNSFWEALPYLADQLGSQLLIKLHPNTLQQHEAAIERLIGRYAKASIRFLPEIPPIYPLLHRCSAYIGDMSSIGYDFLTFDRPLHFCNWKPHLPLHQCGACVRSWQKTDTFSAKRQALYTHVFDPTPDWNLLQEQIDAATANPTSTLPSQLIAQQNM